MRAYVHVCVRACACVRVHACAHDACVLTLHACTTCQKSCDMRHATCDMRHATCDMRHATCDMRHATHQQVPAHTRHPTTPAPTPNAHTPPLHTPHQIPRNHTPLPASDEEKVKPFLIKKSLNVLCTVFLSSKVDQAVKWAKVGEHTDGSRCIALV